MPQGTCDAAMKAAVYVAVTVAVTVVVTVAVTVACRGDKSPANEAVNLARSSSTKPCCGGRTGGTGALGTG